MHKSRLGDAKTYQDHLRIRATQTHADSMATLRLLHQAADHIDRLEAQLIELRAACQALEAQLREVYR